MKTANAKLLVGRTITGFELRPWRDANGVHHSARLTLDNGALVTFSVTETDSGDCYGVTPNYHPASRSRARRGEP